MRKKTTYRRRQGPNLAHEAANERFSEGLCAWRMRMGLKGTSIARMPGSQLRPRGGMQSQASAMPRRATNLTVREDLVAAARQARINLSGLLERALEEELVRLKWRQWRRENAASIAAYNRHIKEHRPFSQILLRW